MNTTGLTQWVLFSFVKIQLLAKCMQLATITEDYIKSRKAINSILESVSSSDHFKRGDVVRYKDGKEIRNAVIGKIPNENNYQDFSDPCYLAYRLDVDLSGNDYLLSSQIILHICEVNKTISTQFQEKEKQNFKNY